MRKLINLIAGTGDWLVGLSNRTRLTLVIGLLLLLGGGGIYKLVVGIQKLNEPLPAASPAQLIEPMEGLFQQTSSSVNQYQQIRIRQAGKLDSLARHYNDKK